MAESFQLVKPEILERWVRIARLMGIPSEAYTPKVKLVGDLSGKSDYSFGVMHNDYRAKRYGGLSKSDCPLCRTVKETLENPSKQLFEESPLDNSIVILNKFPQMIGSALVVSTQTPDVPIHTTENLEGLIRKLDNLFSFADQTGYGIHVNTLGAGASIPWHDHSHLANYGWAFEQAGEIYGFEGAETIPIRKNSRIRRICNYPFFHLIFPQDEAERIVYFLRQLGRKIGPKTKEKIIPHTICQGRNKDILVTPVKSSEGGIGAGQTMGNIMVKNPEDFEKVDFNWCINHLKDNLFIREELSFLERFL